MSFFLSVYIWDKKCNDNNYKFFYDAFVIVGDDVEEGLSQRHQHTMTMEIVLHPLSALRFTH